MDTGDQNKIGIFGNPSLSLVVITKFFEKQSFFELFELYESELNHGKKTNENKIHS